MITISQILFLVVAGLTLGCALMVVTTSNLVHAAFWLIGSLFGVAVIFGMLQAGFLAIVQVVVYIGAIAILFIFAIMLTRRTSRPGTLRFNENWFWAFGIALVVCAGIVSVLVKWSPFYIFSTPLDTRAEPLRMLGAALVSPKGFILPFEVASVLLVSALIGALFIAREKK